MALVIVIAALVGGAIWFGLYGSKTRANSNAALPAGASSAVTDSEHSHSSAYSFKRARATEKPLVLKKANSPTPPAAPVVASETQAPVEADQRTLDTLTSLLVSGAHLTTSSPTRLVDQLKAAGLEPVAARDSDPTTGSMLVIKTNNALPGSRYFSAQFFSDEDGSYNAQDISFEASAATPVDKIVQSMEAQLGRLEAPNFKDASFVRYSLGPCKSLTIQTLTQRDILEGDPNVARSMDDVGTRVVAISNDPDGHCEGEE